MLVSELVTSHFDMSAQRPCARGRRDRLARALCLAGRQDAALAWWRAVQNGGEARREARGAWRDTAVRAEEIGEARGGCSDAIWWRD
eukprot:6174407-Pleurochrysis_carterae.AAC.1